ncbi:DUF6328 family protein [Nonomuraea sp. NPDC050790]|uniref:DUF6328 family protein n=1 Tax=Nonomuraea sp. NPDC050790 TaxID=3364371 RepID=UPI0037A45BD0
MPPCTRTRPRPTPGPSPRLRKQLQAPLPPAPPPPRPPSQDLHRRYAELLQEVRIGQTCVQYLAGFLMALAFMPRFTEISPFQRWVYVAALITTLLAAALLTAPAPFHRLIHGRHLKRRLLAMSNLLTLSGMLLLIIALGGALLLVLDVIGMESGPLIVAAILVAFLAVWFALPMWYRIRHGTVDKDQLTGSR